MTWTFRLSVVAALATLWALGAIPSLSPTSVAAAATGSQIRDRVLSRVERGRLLRAPSIGAAKTAVGGGPGYESVLVGGQVRLFVRYTPNKTLLTGKPAAVVFALHASGGRADQAGAALGLNKLADTEGFITVYPQAADTGWASGPSADTDDVDFINRLADALVAQNVADPARLYLAGVGAGGGMALRLACSDGSRFAAYGAIGAGAPPDNCKPSPPRVSLISGTAADESVTSAAAGTSAAAKPSAGVIAAGVGDAAGSYGAAMGCTSLTQTTQSGKLSRAKLSGCQADAEIEFLRSQERLPVDRALPELWSFFRKFGG